MNNVTKSQATERLRQSKQAEERSRVKEEERERAEKEAREAEARVRGLELGRRWAMELAEYGQLQQVARREERGEDGVLTDSERNSWSFPMPLTSYTLVRSGVAMGRVEEIWSRLTGEPCNSIKGLLGERIFAAHFVAGAAEVWGEIKDQVDP